jgi:hypothetical protein
MLAEQDVVISPNNPLICLNPELDLSVIKRTFDQIPLDPHFEPGYRYRTQSMFRIKSNGDFELLPRKPLYQPQYINSYENYGGKIREYDDIPTWIIQDINFKKLITSWFETLPITTDRFSVHQIRTTTNGGETVPEGRHRDGYEYIGVFVVNRQNITEDSATSTVWLGNTSIELYNGVLKEGMLISFDDKLVTHNVNGITALNPEEKCLRDVLILTVPDTCIG